MKRTIRRFLSGCVLCAAALCLTAAGAVANGGRAIAIGTRPVGAETTVGTEYEIYPNPHRLIYGAGYANLTERINLVLGDGVDQATENAVFRALDTQDVLAEKSAAVRGDRYNVVVGIAGSGDAADTLAAAEIIDAELFARIDAYYLGIDEDAAVILGKDTDAAFYGVATLAAILAQSEARRVRTLTVEDYADCEYRGFIEGYYGIPWTTDERIRLMQFGGQFKSNIYIYAPKDDAYHSSNWRGLYTPSDLAELKEQIAAGVDSKNRFAWSVHPFLHDPITSANYEEGLAAIERKFGQLYDAGVRQFVISADDVEVTEDKPVEAGLHRDLLNAVSAWCKQKGDCYDLIFVPSAYCYLSETRLKVDLEDYFSALKAGLDPDVTIMWTGNDVCSSITTGKFAEFTALTDSKPFFWLNWPVNDYSTKHLLMGKAEVLNGTLAAGETPEYVGVVTNPMQQAEESKLSIFAVADYAWNIADFDCDADYEASFAYVEARETQAFRELCEHLANATLYEGRYFDESTELVPLIDAFVQAYEADADFVAAATALRAALARIPAAADAFLTGAENTALRDSFRPWAQALSYLAQAADTYLEIECRLGEWGQPQIDAAYAEAQSLQAAMAECKAPVLNKISYNVVPETVGVGVAMLSPFLQTLAAFVTDDVLLARGESTGVTYRGFDGVYEGAPANVADGDDATYVWFGSNPAANAYVRVDLGEVTSIGDIRTLTGLPDGRDVFRGTVEYSLDGKHFTAVGTALGTEQVFDFRNRPVEARFVRIRNLDTAGWAAVREIAVNTLGRDTPYISYGNIDLEPSVATSPAAMIDDCLETYAWFDINRTAGAYLLLDLLEERDVQTVQLLMTKPDSGEDYFRGVELQYSSDGAHFTTIRSYVGQRTIFERLTTPVRARYIRALATQTSANGVVVRDFSVNRAYEVSFGDGFALYDEAARAGCPVSHVAYASDGDPNTFLDLKIGAGSARTITLDLGAVREVTRIDILSGGTFGGETRWEDRIEQCVVSYSTDGVTFVDLPASAYAAASADGEYAISLDEAISARCVRVTVLNGGWVTLREFSAS